MRVITRSGIRTVKVILRDYASTNSYQTFVRNESTKEVITIDTTSTIDEIQANNNFFVFTITEEYKEGDELDFYIVETGEDKILHRNKIYVTDQFSEETFFLLLESGYRILLEDGNVFELETA